MNSPSANLSSPLHSAHGFWASASCAGIQKVLRFKSCPASLLFLSCSFYFSPHFYSFSLSSLQFKTVVSNCVEHRGSARKVIWDRCGLGRRSLSPAEITTDISNVYVSCLLLNTLGFQYKIWVWINNFGAKWAFGEKKKAPIKICPIL